MLRGNARADQSLLIGHSVTCLPQHHMRGQASKVSLCEMCNTALLMLHHKPIHVAMELIELVFTQQSSSNTVMHDQQAWTAA